MAEHKTITYQEAGVDIEAGDRLVDLIKPIVRKTYGPRVLGDLGGFAGMLQLEGRLDLFRRGRRDPVLVACTDSTGSKILLAKETGRYDTVGIDLVAMSVNDLITVGAEPLIFLDYVAVNQLSPSQVAEIIDGVANGCLKAGCSLVGGETAELPDIYRPGEFDLVGFAVGIVERRRIIDGSEIEPGDAVIGLPSNGIHSNGYTLVRRLIFQEAGLKHDSMVPEIGCSIGEELLKPTNIYAKPVLNVLHKYRRKRMVRGMAHITGGGLPGNVVRILPEGCAVTIDTNSWTIPPIFELLQSIGVERDEMFRVFNMGIGYVLIVHPQSENRIIRYFRRQGIDALTIGRVRKGSGVEIK
ncbi:MAG: phosphoribosylformylglycinamidine cyclo-ligase [Planctomycetota bacterium]|nr:MAG: phosphoribosylformylglycinamidine cyclo-ligase [Planctomycetota bacterium]